MNKSLGFEVWGCHITLGLDTEFNRRRWPIVGFRHMYDDQWTMYKLGSINLGWLWVGWNYR